MFGKREVQHALPECNFRIDTKQCGMQHIAGPVALIGNQTRAEGNPSHPSACCLNYAPFMRSGDTGYGVAGASAAELRAQLLW